MPWIFANYRLIGKAIALLAILLCIWRVLAWRDAAQQVETLQTALQQAEQDGKRAATRHATELQAIAQAQARQQSASRALQQRFDDLATSMAAREQEWRREYAKAPYRGAVPVDGVRGFNADIAALNAGRAER